MGDPYHGIHDSRWVLRSISMTVGEKERAGLNILGAKFRAKQIPFSSSSAWLWERLAFSYEGPTH